LATFLDEALIHRAVDPARPLELPPVAGTFYRASALKAFCEATGLKHEDVADQLDELLDGHERERIRAHAAAIGVGAGKGAGAGALDDTDVDEDEVEERVREFLRGKGLADDDIEEAIEKVRRDREEARDSRPQPATRGGFGGRFSGATKDEVEAEYGGGHLLDLPNYAPDPDRFGSGYDPLKGRDPAARLPGGGTSRRLSNDAALATDDELAREYPGIENVGTSEWGR
jgi:hypothetical protein